MIFEKVLLLLTRLRELQIRREITLAVKHSQISTCLSHEMHDRKDLTIIFVLPHSSDKQLIDFEIQTMVYTNKESSGGIQSSVLYNLTTQWCVPSNSPVIYTV